jgi:glycosyltransferase involved in cell wall biosynthesis
MAMIKLGISVVVPAHNEAGNLPLLVDKIYKAVKKITNDYEIIIVDDGSTDNSFDILKKIKKQFPKLVIVRLRRQSGQTSGIMAGFRQSSGEIVVVLDADLQQDPNDIDKLIRPIVQGEADVVSGNRQKRQHSMVYRFIAGVEEHLNKWLLGIKIKDTSVSPNAYHQKTLFNLNLYGEMHRFLVPILYWRGFKVIEVPVSHHKRHAGQSNYKPTKAIRGLLDLLVIKFWQDYSSRPIHLFGTIGLGLIFSGTILGIEEAVRKLVFGLSIYNRTLPLLAAFLFIVGIQFLIFGILADILIRLYYKENDTYQVEKLIK